MRRALAAAGVLGAVALSPVATQAAWAEPAPAPQTAVLAIDDEPLQSDGDDDTGKYGFAGLTGLVGLFGYKKIKEHRATRSVPPRPTGGTGGTGPVGGKDDDGSGSRRI